MAGFVENVNKLATDLTPAVISGIADVVAHGDELETLHNNITDVNAVADTIIPNMAEILAADTNAATATTQAGIATTKAGEASASASAALTSELSAASLLDQFDDRYLGSKASAPTLDNDGNALLVGALYFHTPTNVMRVWNGTVWSDALTLTAGSTSTLTNKVIDAMTNTVGADHVHYKCRNVSGSTIAKGVVVTAQGTQSGTDYIEIVPVTDPQTQIALGVTHVSIANNGTGLVLNTGVEEDRNTSAWAVGTILYPNTTGGFTSTKPTTGRYQASAVVLRQHTNQGTLLCEFTEPKYIASTTQAGYVQLNNTLTSTSTTEALTAAQGKVLQDGKQPLDPTLTALSGVSTSADKYIYATAADTFTTGTITSFGRSLVDDADAATARGTLGISATNTPSTAVGGISATNVQGALQELDSEKMSTAEYLTAVGTINNPLLHMPLMNDIDLYKGVGTSTFTRASTATYVDRYGVLKTAGLDEPRFEKEGYLNEGSSTNLTLYSGNFGNASLPKAGTGASLNSSSEVAPDGVAVFGRLTEDTTTGGHYISTYSVAKTAGTTYTESFFVKKDSSSLNKRYLGGYVTVASVVFKNFYVDLDDLSSKGGSVNNLTVKELANGVIRVSYSYLQEGASSSGSQIRLSDTLSSGGDYAGDGSSGFYIWGHQVEALPFATSYIPTTSATVTRAADALSVTANGNVGKGSSEKTYIIDTSVLGLSTTILQTGIELEGVGYNTLQVSNPNASHKTLYYYNNVGYDVFSNSAFPINTNTRLAISISGGTTSTIKTYMNGVNFASSSRTIQTDGIPIKIHIGKNTANSNYLFGHISNLRIYDKALTAQEVALA